MIRENFIELGLSGDKDETHEVDMVTITTFKWVPPFAQGYVRDIRIRWACEEAGISYDLNLIGPGEQETKEYRERQPFSQVPTLQDGSLSLFESGAILLHLGEKSEKLLSKNSDEKAKTIAWVFAGMNSVEPFIQFFNKCQPDDRLRPEFLSVLKKRLVSVSDWLSHRDYLETDRFTIADILMTCVLRELVGSGLLNDFPVLDNYLQRGIARPAFQKALADQLKTFADNALPAKA